MTYYENRNTLHGSQIYLNNNVIVYDFFIRNQKIYFISTFFSPTEPKFSLRIDGIKLQEFAINQPEPVRYFWGFVGTKKTFNLYINGLAYTIEPTIIKPLESPNIFAVATLFKYETVTMIRRFISYYRTQGCTMFYFYYNGPELATDLPTGPDIVYRIWDFTYFLVESEYIHCAQSVFLTTVKFRHFMDCEFLALIDMDEFIVPVDESALIVDYLLLTVDCDVIKIQNHWSKCDISGGPIVYNKDGLGFLDRTKCIYRRSFKGHFAIHEPKKAEGFKVYECNDLRLLHLTTLHSERNMLIKEPMCKTEQELISLEYLDE